MVMDEMRVIMGTRWQLVGIGLVIGVVALFGLALVDVSGGDDISAVTLLDTSSLDIGDFRRAIAPRAWDFPADHGPHPDFQTEWWYYTGNLATESGRRFGFQFTIFRRGITPGEADAGSEWRTNQVYSAHFSISDIESQTFYHDQRFSRGSADLAGAQSTPYRVWLEDWEAAALDAEASTVRIQADAGDFALDLTLERQKPPALQGDAGLSAKGPEAGNASYYYTLSRLLTEGTLRLDEERFVVTGLAWRDHEFGTGTLPDNTQGWDWFGLIFDDNTELMIGQVRLIGGDTAPAYGGLRIAADGSTEYLASDQIRITPTATWESPHTGGVYPAGWTMRVETAEGTLHFDVTPLMSDQELSDTQPTYWEGAVRVTGDVQGYGYAELTGYTEAMRNRF